MPPPHEAKHMSNPDRPAYTLLDILGAVFIVLPYYMIQTMLFALPSAK
jgi:hypothetical protein